ncbi:MAG: threonine-phosphate decarboxylase [Marinosulfonomonas sp.]|nr:MAG: threonine-phosphate decarboxylase [Marinosulfonomonas sp.]
MTQPRDHGGGIDAARAEFGGARSKWLDLSTGINPVPYPIPAFEPDAWNALPDQTAMDAVTTAARQFWDVPDDAAILAAPGASALIARIPYLAELGKVRVESCTYNEHEAAFRTAGWDVSRDTPSARVIVSPNNPTGDYWTGTDQSPLLIVDESFCDLSPEKSRIDLAANSGTLILKSFGKFWGLAGLRLGFAIGDPALIENLANALGPWPVSGPALRIGAAALSDQVWAAQTRARLAGNAARLDTLMLAKGAEIQGGTDLFRLYRVDDAAAWQSRLAQHHIWSRIFPYSKTWLRLGLPAPDRWDQLELAL